MSSMWPARAHEWMLLISSGHWLWEWAGNGIEGRDEGGEGQFGFDEQGADCYDFIIVVLNDDGEI